MLLLKYADVQWLAQKLIEAGLVESDAQKLIEDLLNRADENARKRVDAALSNGLGRPRANGAQK